MEKEMEGTGRLQVAEIELTYKPKIKASERPIVTDSRSIYQLLIQHWNPHKIELQEQFKLILLNRRLSVLGIVDIATGGITEVAVDIRLVFASALKANAINIVIAHNHPSESLTPSKADLALTKQFKNAGDILQVHVLDHLIVTPIGYYSFADEGLL